MFVALTAAAFAADTRLLRAPGFPGDAPAYTTFEDAEGWLWFGTVLGLHRYDGERAVRWGGEGFLRDVVDIEAVDDGAVQVRTKDRRLYTVYADHAERRKGPDGADLPPVDGAATDGAGGLWVAYDGGLWHTDSGGWRRVGDVPDVISLHAANGGGVWITEAQQLRHVDGAGHELPPLAVPWASDVAEAGGVTWIASRTRHVYRVDGSGVHDLHTDVDWALSVVAVADGAWVATSRALLRFRGDRLALRVEVPDGIAQNDSLRLDHEGSLWVATFNGPRVRPSPDAANLTPDALPDADITSVTPWNDDLFLTGWTHAGTLHADGSYTPAPWAFPGWPPCRDAAGGLWSYLWPAARDPDRVGFVRVAGGAPDVLLLPDGVTGNSCQAASPGGFWLALSTGLAYAPSAAGPLRMLPMPGHRADVAYEDGKGHLWAFAGDQACDGAVAAVLAEAPDAWRCGPSGAPDYVDQIAEVGGALWAGGDGSGVLERRGDAWVRLPASDTLGASRIYALRPRGADEAWLTTPASVVRVRRAPDTPGGFTVLERIASGNGAPDAGAQDLVERPDGSLLLATHGGLQEVPSGDRAGAPAPPVAAIGELRADGRPAAAEAVASWPHNQVEVQAAAPTYRDRSQLRFRFRVDDDAPWSEPAAASLARFVDLPAGDYALSVQASTDGHTWSPASPPRRLRVVKPWYLRTPTLLAGLLALGGAALAAARQRAAARARVEAERRRIAMELHDDLGAGLSTVSMLTGLAADASLDDAARRSIAAQAADTAAGLGASLGDIVWTLRREAGSPEAVARSVVERARRTFPGARPRLHVDVAPAWPAAEFGVREFRELQLFAQEALGNAARHAEAENVWLRFHPWRLVVEDDGRGLGGATAHPGTGSGLANLAARAEALGATLELGARPGGGTRVALTWSRPPGARPPRGRGHGRHRPHE